MDSFHQKTAEHQQLEIGWCENKLFSAAAYIPRTGSHTSFVFYNIQDKSKVSTNPLLKSTLEVK